MRILILLAVVGAACAAPPFIAPVATVQESAPVNVPVAALPPVTYITRHHAQDELGQVNYGFSHPGQVKNEVRDEFGNVAGAYSYIDADNKPVHVQYTAGFDGFQVRSNNLPVGPSALDAPEPVKDLPEVFSAKQKFVEVYNSAAMAAAAAPDDDVISEPAVHSSDQVVWRAAVHSADEVVLEPAVDTADEVVLETPVDSADAVFTDDDEDVDTSTSLGVLAGDEDLALETDDTSAFVEIKQNYKAIDDEFGPSADKQDSVFRVSPVNIEAIVPEAEEEPVLDTVETPFLIKGVPETIVYAAPLPEADRILPQRIPIQPIEVHPNLAATDDNAHFKTDEVSKRFPTLVVGPVVPAYTSETSAIKAESQDISLSTTAEDTPVFNLDGSVTRYFGYLPPVHGSVSPLYTKAHPYGSYGIHAPMPIPLTVPGYIKTSYTAAQTPMPYYHFLPRNYMYHIPYASRFLNYIPLKDC